MSDRRRRDGDIPIRVALFAASGIGLTFTVARYAMPDAFDTAQPFDIDVDHVAGRFFFVADDGFFRLQGGQERQASRLADEGRCGAGQAHFRGDLPEGHALAAHRLDGVLLFLAGLFSQPARSAGSILQPGGSFGLVPPHPFADRGVRNV